MPRCGWLGICGGTGCAMGAFGRCAVAVGAGRGGAGVFITRGATTGAWATTLTGGRAIAGAGAERAICCCCWIGSGRPGVRASALCRCWNDEGGGAGAVLATTGRLMTAAEGRGVLATGAAGRPSDQRIGFQRGKIFEDEIFTVPSAGGEPRQMTQDGNQLSGFSWLPDGSGIVYASARGSTVLYHPTFNIWVSRHNRASRQLTFGEVSYIGPDLHPTGKLVVGRMRMGFDLW